MQTTSRTNVSARVNKIKKCKHLPNILAAGWKILVHGWDIKDGTVRVRVVEIDSYVDPLEVMDVRERSD